MENYFTKPQEMSKKPPNFRPNFGSSGSNLKLKNLILGPILVRLVNLLTLPSNIVLRVLPLLATSS